MTSDKANTFDAACRDFTAACQIAADWKNGIAGAAYMSRIEGAFRLVEATYKKVVAADAAEVAHDQRAKNGVPVDGREAFRRGGTWRMNPYGKEDAPALMLQRAREWSEESNKKYEQFLEGSK